MLTQERLKERLNYDPLTGIFTWRAHLKSGFNRKEGDIAGCLSFKGYLDIGVEGQSYKAHRLAWFYVHGEWPKHQIDHINGAREDNRIENLREATNHQNTMNAKMKSTNKSGIKGVHFETKVGRWRAEFSTFGKRKFLGYFKTKEEAALTLKKIRAELHGEFCRH